MIFKQIDDVMTALCVTCIIGALFLVPPAIYLWFRYQSSRRDYNPRRWF